MRRRLFHLRIAAPAHLRVLMLVLICTCALWPSGCAARRTPDLDRIFAAARMRPGKRPIIVIPGVLGSQLVNRKTREVVWPAVLRGSGDDLGLPMTPNLAANCDDLVPEQIVDTIRLGRLVPIEIYVYRELIAALERYGGYRMGNWDQPPPGGDRDTFYVFAYDWRRDNVETARALVRRVEELKRKLNRPDLRFNIVAHSMGGLVARYAAMYGDADLPAAPQKPHPTWAGAAFINKVFMFGVPNEGSAEAFAALLDGYSVTEGLRPRVRLLNKLSREDICTAPSIFQLLPHNGAARFLDEHLRPMKIDLYDPEVWRRYGWSAIFDPDFRERYVQRSESKGDGSAAKRTLEDLDAYFAVVLGRAKQFHEAIDAGSAGNAPVLFYAFGGDCEETLAAPIILRDEKRNRWVTLTVPRAYHTSDGRRVSRKQAISAMFEPGDGRVTRQSLLAQNMIYRRRTSLFNSTLPITYVTFTCDLHSDLQKNKTLQDNALTLLVNELVD
jgi:pimeloyl-ACP methyl ester carboxylesterase